MEADSFKMFPHNQMVEHASLYVALVCNGNLIRAAESGLKAMLLS